MSYTLDLNRSHDGKGFFWVGKRVLKYFCEIFFVCFFFMDFQWASPDNQSPAQSGIRTGNWAGKPSVPGPSQVWAIYGIWLGLQRDLSGARLGKPRLPARARTNPAWGPCGICMGNHGLNFQLALFHDRTNTPERRPVVPMDIPYGPQAGFVWAWAGSLGLPVRAPFKSLCKPSQIPHVAQTGLGTGRLGLPAQIPHGPRAGSLSGLWVLLLKFAKFKMLAAPLKGEPKGPKFFSFTFCYSSA